MKRLLVAAALALASAAAFAQTKVHWYGQAAFRIETPSGGVILIDPWLTPAQLKAALDKRGVGARMVEMKPGETRTFPAN